jgi:hypothetical protein
MLYTFNMLLTKTYKILFEIDFFCKSCVMRVIWNTENLFASLSYLTIFSDVLLWRLWHTLGFHNDKEFLDLVNNCEMCSIAVRSLGSQCVQLCPIPIHCDLLWCNVPPLLVLNTSIASAHVYWLPALLGVSCSNITALTRTLFLDHFCWFMQAVLLYSWPIAVGLFLCCYVFSSFVGILFKCVYFSLSYLVIKLFC